MPDPPTLPPSPWESRRSRALARRLVLARIWSLVWRTALTVVVWFLACYGLWHLLQLDRVDLRKILISP